MIVEEVKSGDRGIGRRNDPLGALVSGNAKLPDAHWRCQRVGHRSFHQVRRSKYLLAVADRQPRQFGGLIVSVEVGIAQDSRWAAAWRDRLTQLNVELALVRRIARAGISKVVSPGV